jgi:hypothetical protein
MPAFGFASRQWHGEDPQHFFSAGGAAGWIHHLSRVPFREHKGDLMASGTFRGVNHYRFYELDHSDHIEAITPSSAGRTLMPCARRADCCKIAPQRRLKCGKGLGASS